MVGIGPFIPHSETPFKDYPQGLLRDTLIMVALARLILPNALIPSTTALGTIHPEGRELGLKAEQTLLCLIFRPLDSESFTRFMTIRYVPAMNPHSAECASRDV